MVTAAIRCLNRSEPNPHPLSDLSRDLSSDRRDDSGRLSQLGRFKAGSADLSGRIHLSNVNLFVGPEFDLIALLDTAARLGSLADIRRSLVRRQRSRRRDKRTLSRIAACRESRCPVPVMAVMGEGSNHDWVFRVWKYEPRRGPMRLFRSRVKDMSPIVYRD